MASQYANMRVLMISVEGGTWRVLTPAIEQGCMPNLRQYINKGASGTLVSTIPVSVAAEWAALHTGCYPGETGIFCETLFDRASRRSQAVSTAVLPDTLMEQVERAGKLVVSVNVPLTWPPRLSRGAIVAGPLAPDGYRDSTWPSGLKEELRRTLGDDAAVGETIGFAGLPREGVEDFLQRAAGRLAGIARVTEHLIVTRNPDLCMVHFHLSDTVEHALWCYLDPQDPWYDEAVHALILERFYSALDQAIGRLCDVFAGAGEGPFVVLVISDHGFELHRKKFHLGTWLHQQGLLQPSEGISASRRWRIANLLAIGRYLKRLLPKARRSGLEEAGTGSGARRLQTSATHAVGCDDGAGIYLLAEDAPHRVNATARITKGLKVLRDSFTSAPIIQGVYRKEELYRGAGMALLPDLIVVPSAGYSCTVDIRSDSCFVQDVNPETDRDLGKHHPEGIIVAYGPVIGDRIAVRMYIVDVAPTILYALGLPVPLQWDGKTVTELFTDEFISARGPQDGG